VATGILTIQQSISAGSDFDGTPPTGAVVRGSGIWKYPEDVVGGLIDFALTAPHAVRSVELKLGGQSAWTVHKKDLDGRELLVICGTTENDFLTTEADSFILTDGQVLVVRTTGANAALMARVSVQAYR
jgi:hypothetical protein